MIAIDFIGGAHGNFLEFVCNVSANIPYSGSPFDIMGSAHLKPYTANKLFFASHYSYLKIPLPSSRIVSIRIAHDDLLQLSQISLLRAGEIGYDNNTLEIDTYNKLNSVPVYKWILDNLIESFFTNQIKDSYNAVKDPTWPEVSSMREFWNLPEYIRNECQNVHNLELLELSQEQPNCPRHVLREFFQIGFENPTSNGFIKQQESIVYNNNADVYNFPFSCFYHNEFFNQIEMVAQWAGFTYTKQTQIADLHAEFLERQPYKDSKIKCDHIVQQLINGEITPPVVTLMEEAYINAMLKKSGHECRY